jgi:hypothetical protein
MKRESLQNMNRLLLSMLLFLAVGWGSVVQGQDYRIGSISVSSQSNYLIPGVPATMSYTVTINRNPSGSNGGFDANLCVDFSSFPSAFTYYVTPSASASGGQIGFVPFASQQQTGTAVITIVYDGTYTTEGFWPFPLWAYRLPANSNASHSCAQPTADVAYSAGGVLILGIPPHIECPADITIDNEPGLCEADVTVNLTYDGLTATTPPVPGHYIGNPQPVLHYSLDGGITYTQIANNSFTETLAVGVHEITLWATTPLQILPDDYCTFYITVEDNEDPVIAPAASPLTVECDGSGNTAALNAWLNNNGGATATDNCDLNLTWTNDFDWNNFTYTCGGAGSILVTFTVADDDNNTATTSALFTIEDTTDPVWVDEPVNITVECDGSGNTDDLNDWLGSFSGSDVCGTATVSDDYDPANFVAACGATGHVDVEFTLTDACGNDISKTVRFTIVDTTDPVWVDEPDNITVECDGSGNTDDLNDWLGSFSGSDICGTANVSDDYDPANFVAACGATGHVDVEFTLTDACGNDISKTVRFTIVDTTDPVWVDEPDNITVECDGSGNTDDLNDWLGSFSGSDVCGTATVSDDYDPANFVAACGATGHVDVEFTLTDACGNDISKTVRFTIVDTTDPVWVDEPDNITVECDGSGNTDDLNDWLGSFSGSDICGTATVSDDYDPANFVAACGATGHVDVEFTLTDACGNDISKTVRFTIVDTTDPVWVDEPDNITVECDGSGNTDDLNDWLGSFSGSDICGTANVSDDYDPANFVAACGATGHVDVEFTLTDACGNDISKTVRFTIVDTTDPVWVDEPDNITVECDGSGNTDDLNDWLGSFSGSDVCGTANVSDDYDPANFVAACGATGHVDVEFTLTDACGNDISKTVRFTIVDTTDPVWVDEPDNITVECDGSGNTDDLNDWLGSFSGSDICGTANVSDDYDPANFVAACGATGHVDVEFTLTDACGNDISKTVRFTIVDTTDPVWVDEPDNITVECDGSGNTDDLNDWLGSFSGSDVCGTATVSDDYDPANFVAACGATGHVDVEFTLTDACGNDISKTVRFTIVDTTDPVWVDEPDNITVECDGSGNTDDLNDWLGSFSGSDVCGTATVSDDYDPANFVAACGATGHVDVEFTLTDACGNDISKTVRFTIVDTEAPVPPTPPANVTLICKSDIPAMIDLTADDVCEGDITVTGVDAYGTGTACYGDPLIITRTWTFVDDCLNSSAVSQTITVEGLELVCEIDEVAEEDRPFCNTPDNVLTATVTGGCDKLYIYTWTVSSPDGTWLITGTDQTTGAVTYTAGMVGDIATFTLLVEDENGCTTTCTYELECQGGAFCTWTQGFYGNDVGQDCDNNTTTQLINEALGVMNPIYVGQSVSNHFAVTSAPCVIQYLPGGTTPVALTSTYDCSNLPAINSLVAQTLTLKLNMNIGDNGYLGDLKLAAGKDYMITAEAVDCYNFESEFVPGTEANYYVKKSVTGYLNANNMGDVNGLVALADAAISGVYAPQIFGDPTLLEITAMVDVINNAFHNCRVIVGWGNDPISFPKMAQTVQQSADLNMYPNPTTGNVTILIPEEGFTHIRVVGLDGKTIMEVPQTELDGQFQVTLHMQNAARGIYYVFAYNNNVVASKGKLVIVR